jgi:hypothetical protein
MSGIGASEGQEVGPFPVLFANKPCIPAYYHCCSIQSFKFYDVARDRGVPKIAKLGVEISTSSGVSCSTMAAALKIDCRKSFSNIAFKKYYARGKYALWNEWTSASGLLLILLSQRTLVQRQTTSFVGLLHQPDQASAKHPLVCLSSNDIEYECRIFVESSMRASSLSLTVQYDHGYVDVRCSDSSTDHAASQYCSHDAEDNSDFMTGLLFGAQHEAEFITWPQPENFAVLSEEFLASSGNTKGDGGDELLHENKDAISKS